MTELRSRWSLGPLTLADFATASTFVCRRPARPGVEDHAHVADWIARLKPPAGSAPSPHQGLSDAGRRGSENASEYFPSI